MFDRTTMVTLACAAALGATMSGAWAFDESKYPDLSGQWRRIATGAARYDPAKPPGRGQEAPLKAEYKVLHEASIACPAPFRSNSSSRRSRPTSCSSW